MSKKAWSEQEIAAIRSDVETHPPTCICGAGDLKIGQVTIHEDFAVLGDAKKLFIRSDWVCRRCKRGYHVVEPTLTRPLDPRTEQPSEVVRLDDHTDQFTLF